jgi:hypothetical protein
MPSAPNPKRSVNASKKKKKPAKPAAACAPSPPERDEEWVGGFFSLRAFVHEGDQVYRPETVVWLTEQGFLAACSALPPGDVVAGAVDSFEAATRAPLRGQPRRPARVRVASPALAEGLRARLGPGVEVRVAPTPEVDAVAGELEAHLAASPDDRPPSYLGDDIDAPAVAAFFRAAASLYRASPWKVVSNDTDLLSLSMPSLGVNDVAMCVVGQGGQSYGLLLFATVQDFETYVEQAEAAAEEGPPPQLPPFVSLSFDPAAELHPALRAEIAEQRWEVVGQHAYPTVTMVDEALVGRRPTRKELAAAEAIALGVARLMEDPKALARAFKRGSPVEATYRVETHSGPHEVLLRAPHPARR